MTQLLLTGMKMGPFEGVMWLVRVNGGGTPSSTMTHAAPFPHSHHHDAFIICRRHTDNFQVLHPPCTQLTVNTLDTVSHSNQLKHPKHCVQRPRAHLTSTDQQWCVEGHW